MWQRRMVPTRRIPRWLVVVPGAVFAVLLVGCGAAEDEGLPGIDPVEDPDTTEDRDADTGDDLGDESQEGSDVDRDRPEVASAVSDAAERTGTDPADIEVVAFEQVTWSDGAMGCPEPGQMYTQALVEGYRVLVTVDGAELTYHGAEGDAPFLCEDPQPPLETQG